MRSHMLTFCTQWRFIPSKRRYQLYSTIKLVRYYPNKSCHAAMLDQPGLPSIGSGRRTGGSRRRPHLPDLPLTVYCIDPAAARPCCVAVFQSNRKSAAQTATMHACLKIEPSRAGCVRLCAYRQRAEHSGRLRSCRHAWLRR